MTRKVSAAEAKRKFSELVSHVQYRGDRVLIQKRGKPAAALVSIQDLEYLPQISARTSSRDTGTLLDAFPEWKKILKKAAASRRRDRPPKVRIG